MRKGFLIWVLAGFTGVLGSAPGMMAGTAQAAEVQIIISDFAFSPETLTIKVGDTVEFVNEDGIPHSGAREGKDGFDTQVLNQGQSKKITFSKPGEYTYNCSIHPSMSGKIIVKE